ncbi:MAG: hypothetical protein A3E01_10775 [Gammaproteobacteria bacterium RIFCSPHIGHO2_12_FULL_63_22]|nr:MAG: hypothetical protein A3E01_10775 [Gammaproteobacteria bacterium RIFCSPHIGHO2_12_FULL_63_22]
MLHLFLPKQAGANPRHLLDAGLGELLRPDDEQPACVDLDGPGPGGQGGQVWSWLSPTSAPAYRPESQTWHQARGAPYWYGFDAGQPPPESLARKFQYGGRTQVLRDGQPWAVPAVDYVPHVIGLDPQGQLCKIPDAAYAQFAAESGELLADFARNQLDSAGWTWQRLFGFVVSALALNYRINAEIATRLGLFRDDDLFTTAFYVGAADQVRPILADLEKKKQAESPSGSAPSAG